MNNKIYRYVCPHCLRTFLDKLYNEDLFCWKCGQGLEVIPKEIIGFNEKANEMQTL